MSNNLATKKGEKVHNFFECEFCDFTCSNKYGWDRHIMTSKHIKATKSNKKQQFSNKKGCIK